MTQMRIVTVPALAEGGWETVAGDSVLLGLMPETTGPLVLRFNGEFLLRADWPETVGADDVVEWLVDQPEDREGFRTFLQIAAVAAAFATAGGASPYLSVAFAAAGVAYNLLVPPAVLEQNDDPAKAIYNASLGGNQARIDQPIWRICGVDRINPPFAAMPYYEYDANGDQFYYAVFAIGYGPHDILAEFIGKTPISGFSDVTRHAYLAPGELPTTAQANVVTSREVSGMELETGRFVGGFVACGPAQLATSIGFDIIAPQGLGKMATESDENITVTVKWQFDYQQVNEAGAPLDVWRLLDFGEKTMSTNTPQRWSIKKNLPFPMRVKVRGARANLKDTAVSARDGIQWAGMRAYLSEPAPLNEFTSHYEIVMRASEQLSAQSQTDFSVIAQGKCRTWNAIDGWNCEIGDFDNYVATRNPAWWMADVWSDTVWGEGLPDERIDLQTLYDLSLIWDQRQDRFDYTFSATSDAWTASQLIASAGRARAFRRYGVRSLARDALVELGETAFTPRTCIGDMTMSEVLPRATDPDGIIVEYVSNVTWDLDTIECPCPGVVEMTQPVYQRFEGVKGYTHAKREGLYHAADMALRQRTVTCRTEMQALVASFMLPVRWQPLIPGYGQTGDVAFWNEDTLVMGLTEQPDFSRGDTYLTLRRDDGSLTEPVRVFPGPTVWDVVLPAIPDFDPVLDDGTRERPIFLLGTLDAGDELVKVNAIKDGGKSSKGAQYFDIEAVVDNSVVHTVDNAYLPGPGDIQDPIGLPGDEGGGGGGTLVLVTLQDHTIADGQGSLGGGTGAGIRLNNDGRLQLIKLTNDGPNPAQYIAGEWLLIPVEPSTSADFEVFAHTNIDFTGDSAHYLTGDAVDTWLNLGTTRQWVSSYGNYNYVTLNVQIRKVGETVLQANRTMILQVFDVYEGGGG